MTHRVLVLGATSYVAQFVLRRFLENSTTVEGVSSMACTIRSRIEPSELPSGLVPAGNDDGDVGDSTERRVEVFAGVDLTDVEALRSCILGFRPDTIVDCVGEGCVFGDFIIALHSLSSWCGAALSSPATCQRQPELSKALNEPYSLLGILNEVGTPIHLVHFSTDFVYLGDRPAGGSYAEEDAVLDDGNESLLSAYGTAKLRFDTFIQSNPPPGGCSILRIANVVGPRAPLFRGGAPKFLEWLHIQLFASFDASSPLKLWSDEHRSFIFVEDLVDIVFGIVNDAAPSSLGLARVVNVGGQEALTRVELATRYLAACLAVGLIQEGTDSVRTIAPTSRTNVDFGYHSPLNAQLDTSKLDKFLPGLTRMPTDAFLEIIAREMS